MSTGGEARLYEVQIALPNGDWITFEPDEAIEVMLTHGEWWAVVGRDLVGFVATGTMRAVRYTTNMVWPEAEQWKNQPERPARATVPAAAIMSCLEIFRAPEEE